MNLAGKATAVASQSSVPGGWTSFGQPCGPVHDPTLSAVGCRQFSWPPAGSYLAVYGQFLVAVVSRAQRLWSGRP